MAFWAERTLDESTRAPSAARYAAIAAFACSAGILLLLAAALVYGLPDSVRALAILGASLTGTLMLAIGGLAWLVRRARPALARSVSRPAARRDVEDAATIAHDLRAPLATVNSYLSLLAEEQFGPMPPAAREAVGRAALATSRLEAMVEATLLNDARAAAAGRDKPVVTDLNDVVAEVIASLSTRSEAQRAEIHVGPLPVVRGDTSRLFRIFQNLVDNALKYHAPDQPPRIAITGAVVHERGEIVVRDYGIGVPAHERRQVFERASRGAGSAVAAGCGLGLANVRRLAQELGGQADIDEAVTPGLAIRVSLPAA